MSNSADIPLTSFQTPDPAFGGPAVDSPSNTGHGSSNVGSSSPSTSSKSCRWSGFTPSGLTLLSATIKVDWNRTAASLSGDGTNNFFIEYSLDGGTNWSTLLSQSNVSGSASGTASVAISTGQNFSNVRVRDGLDATGGASGSASLTAIISNIRIEITYNSPPKALLSSMA